MSDQLDLDLDTRHAITVTIERDFDGRWTSRWPAEVVLAGRSAGAGRHDTRAALVAAIEARGFRLRHHRGDAWHASEVDR